eukprot:NODE_2952_length_841_cov_33.530303_g2448_i0.p3 GENE.NODE_2952_length_841_cov_33.530303_g2448_i0~~NODE_2952_length_841_cov_33.530303_g2448_i0.p3  ORF type:complete len:70 (-),score=5.86 NODE_2952_length_841_cov_33.530303_g2448_i0:607-816(-)
MDSFRELNGSHRNTIHFFFTLNARVSWFSLHSKKPSVASKKLFHTLAFVGAGRANVWPHGNGQRQSRDV